MTYNELITNPIYGQKWKDAIKEKLCNLKQ